MLLSRENFFYLLSQGYMTKYLTQIRKDLHDLDPTNFDNFLKYNFRNLFYSELYGMISDFITSSEVELLSDVISIRNLKTNFDPIVYYQGVNIIHIWSVDQTIYGLSSIGNFYKVVFETSSLQKLNYLSFINPADLVEGVASSAYYDGKLYLGLTNGKFLRIADDFNSAELLYTFTKAPTDMIIDNDLLFIKHLDYNKMEVFDGTNEGSFHDDSYDLKQFAILFNNEVYFLDENNHLKNTNEDRIFTDNFHDGENEIVCGAVFNKKLYLMNKNGYVSTIDRASILEKLDITPLSTEDPFIALADSKRIFFITKFGLYTFFDKFDWSPLYKIGETVIDSFVSLNGDSYLSGTSSGLHKFLLDDWGTYQVNINVDLYKDYLSTINFDDIDTELGLCGIPIEIKSQLRSYWDIYDKDTKLNVLLVAMFLTIKKLN